MENYFYKELNNNTIEAVKRGAAFFMKENDSYIPPLNNSFSGAPITGANYYNIRLSNDLNGTNHTEYVKMNEVLSSNVEWVSTLARENKPRSIVYQDENLSENLSKNTFAAPRYAFMMPAAELNQDVFHDYTRNAVQDVMHFAPQTAPQNAPRNNYVPYQSSAVPMSDFENFIREQCANALNASLTGCAYKNNIPAQEMEQFKTQLIDKITENPGFMAAAADKARQEVNEFHRLPIPFDRNGFIEKARNEASAEFSQLNSAIIDHVNDMCQNKKRSFNPEFDELARPLVIRIEHVYEKPAIDREITEFVKEKIKQDKPAAVLADTYTGSLVEKAKKLIQENPRVNAGLSLACSIINPILAKKIEPEDFVKIADNVITLMKLAGNKIAKNTPNVKDTRDANDNRGSKDTRGADDNRALHAAIEKIIRNNPQILEKAMTQLDKEQHHTHAHSAARR